MIEQTILLKYLEGNATDEERESVVEWLESNEDNLQELIKLRKLHNISIFNEPMKGEEEGNPIFTKKNPVRVCQNRSRISSFSGRQLFLE